MMLKKQSLFRVYMYMLTNKLFNLYLSPFLEISVNYPNLYIPAVALQVNDLGINPTKSICYALNG